MKVWRKQTIRYFLGNKRATKSTPEALPVKELSKRFYGTLNTFDGRKKQIPLTVDANTSNKLLRRLQGNEDEKRANGVDRFYDERQRSISELLTAYIDYLTAKGNTSLHVKTQASRIRKLFAATKATTLADLDSSRVLTTLSAWRSRKSKPMSVATSNHYLVAKGLTALFDDLCKKKIGLFSLRDSLDLSTPAGRLMANVLASVAAYETEVRAERVLAGQAAARAQGKVWGGSKKGRLLTVTKEQRRHVLAMKGEKIARIARTVGLSRPTIYRLLEQAEAN